jgi:hypothetical protein
MRPVAPSREFVFLTGIENGADGAASGRFMTGEDAFLDNLQETP